MKKCEDCFYWSDKIAGSYGCGPMEALCFNEDSKMYQKNTSEDYLCEGFKQSINGKRIDSD